MLLVKALVYTLSPLLSSPLLSSPLLFSNLLPTHREGDAGRGEGATGQHPGEEGQEEGKGEADGGGPQAGISTEEKRAEGSWDWVRDQGVCCVRQETKRDSKIREKRFY